MSALSPRLVSLYRKNRRHQNATYGNSGLREWSDTKQAYVDVRQFVGGGAAYQCHAIAAYWSARSHMHFIDTHTKGAK